jgi:hypothetical protein
MVVSLRRGRGATAGGVAGAQPKQIAEATSMIQG